MRRTGTRFLIDNDPLAEQGPGIIVRLTMGIVGAAELQQTIVQPGDFFRATTNVLLMQHIVSGGKGTGAVGPDG